MHFRGGGLMTSQCNDLSIDQLLDDPMTLAVMRADGVDPISFKAMLAGQIARLRNSSGAARLVAAADTAFSITRAPAYSAAGSSYDSCRAF
jgi:hypothetical protein